MENKSHALAAGAFVLAVTALLVAMALWLMSDKGVTKPFELTTRDTGTGLQPQAAVRFKGVSVGRVTHIGFDPDTAGNVLIRIAVDADAPLTPTTFATLSYQGITGLAFIQLDDDGTKTADAVEKGSSGVPRLPLRTSQLGEISAKVPEILAQVDEMTLRLNQLLSDANQKHIAQALEGAAQSAGAINRLANTLDHTLTQRLDPALASLPLLAASTDKTLQALQATATDVSRTANAFTTTAERLNAPNGPMDRLAQGTGALAHAADGFGSTTLPRINRVGEDASRAMRQLSRTVVGINDNPQSLVFGNGTIQPGPGEPGFVSPSVLPATASGARP